MAVMAVTTGKQLHASEVLPAKASRPSFFSRPGAISKEHAAKVFQDHAPPTDSDGNTHSLVKPRIAKSTVAQRDRALAIWGE